MAHHPVAVAFVLMMMMMMMMVSLSNCTMSNIASTAAGNSTAVASSAWCNGKIEDGQCMLVADAAAYGEHLDVDVMGMVVQYFDSSEISRRVLGVKGKPHLVKKTLNLGMPAASNPKPDKPYGGCRTDVHKRKNTC